MAPKEVKAIAGEFSISIVWDKAEGETEKYRIYRSVDGENFDFIHETVLTSYKDSKVWPENTYIYKVTSVNFAGYESEGALTELVMPYGDTTPPEIKGIVPESGSSIKGTVYISVLATDNVGVSGIEFYYRSEEDDRDEWISLGSIESGMVFWNTEELKDGAYELKVVVKDAAGNTKEIMAEYYIDNTAGEPPLLEAVASEMKITLMWEPQKVEEDFDHYRVYRKTEEDGEFELIGRTDKTTYVDSRVTPDKDLWYKVSVVDRSGNESEDSNIVKIKAGKDVTGPVVKRFDPISGSVLRGGVALTAYAQDNDKVSWYSFEYRKLGENEEDEKDAGDGEWTAIAVVNNTGDGEVTVRWDTLATGEEGEALYPDGKYQVKLTVCDSSGNKTEKIQSYIVANDPPSPPEHIYVQAGEWELIVSWSPVVRPDFDHYVLYRKEGRDGTWEKIVDYTTSNLYIDRMRNPLKEYFYRVAVVNDLGRESEPTHDYSLDEQISDKIAIRALHQTSIPIILEVKPSELSKTKDTMELKTLISDKVGIEETRYEYAYLGKTPSAPITGEEIWHLIGVDTSFTMENYNRDIYNKERCFVSEAEWDVTSLADGTYAVRISAFNKGNKEASVIKRYIVDRSAPKARRDLWLWILKPVGNCSFHGIKT